MDYSRPVIYGIEEALHSEHLDVNAVKTKLISEAVLESDWPLRMRSRTRNDTAEWITEDTEIDCPEYNIPLDQW